jgi:hypothetical protein
MKPKAGTGKIERTVSPPDRVVRADPLEPKTGGFVREMSQNSVAQGNPETCAQREASMPEQGATPAALVTAEPATALSVETNAAFIRPAKDKFRRACKTCTSPNVAEIEALASMGWIMPPWHDASVSRC